ncbi:hypothetical protein BIV08_21970 [Pseudomonas sp. AF76]|uniref:DUF5677 domain-containing protein n=1 Tax=Pseudomonas sp. AF76 TaxID=554393 RepID=UPI000F46BC36|nr:DUF5677 domain-containing protein [Pseudomonas sp. AF76]ROO36963.1 hypothetical protein BIV08_21970 [Pseudomonas sp. AF76]
MTLIEDEGFLSEEARNCIPAIRQENEGLFELANDVNTSFMALLAFATESAKVNLQSPQSVAVRLAFRAINSLQSVVLLTERGIVADSRTLARSVLEDAFAIGALVDDPVKFMSDYELDHQNSTHRQLKFVASQQLSDPKVREKIEQKLNAAPKGKQLLAASATTKGRPLEKLYLYYLVLSNDSAHPSATSLEHHVFRADGGTGWHYKWSIADASVNASTLHIALSGIIAIAIALREYLKLVTFGDVIDALWERLEAL